MNETFELLKNFDVDGQEYRPLAFFGIDIEQDNENIKNWVRWCKSQGFRGFNIIVGSGCDGRANDQWINKLMEAYEVAFKEAKKNNLEAWIFDDWGYPSGTAGGLVCTEPSFRAKKLHLTYDVVLEPGSSIELEIPEKFLAAGIFPEVGEYEYLEIDQGPGEIFTYQVAEESPGVERLVFVTWAYDKQKVKSSCRSYPGDPAMSCIDMLNPRATEKFVEVIHERYYNRFSEYMDDLIQGFFYDEPYVAYPFPWTEKLPEKFSAEKNYELLQVLPRILVEAPFAHTGPVLKYAEDYFDVWTDMVQEGFYGILSEWCQEHNLELSGHMDLEHHLETLHTISGHFYKNMQCNDRPAIDVIWAQIAPDEFSDYPRYAGSLKRLLGKKRATSETFAGMGYGLSGDLMRFITDHQALRGIDDFHLMYSSNNPPEEETYSPQMPEHMLQEPFGKLIYERIAAGAAVSALGQPRIKTALLVPAGKLNQARLGLRNIHINNADRLPWKWVNEIAEFLTYYPCNFDYIWEEAILELESVAGGLQAESGYVLDTIIIPPESTLSDRTVEKLQEFQKTGGKVISVFKPFWPLVEKGVMCNQVKDLKQHIKPAVICSGDGISVSERKVGKQSVYLLLNETGERKQVELDFCSRGTLYRLSLNDGSLEQLKEAESLEINTEFLAREMQVFLVVEEQNQGGNVDYQKFLLQRGEVKAEITENWELEVPGPKIINLENNVFPDWQELGFPEYSGSMDYRVEFEWDQKTQEVLLQTPELYSHCIFYLDGQEVGRSAYQPHEIKVKLTRGSHELKLRVYNTPANKKCGTLAAEKEKYKGRFAALAHYDRRRLQSGLLGPVKITGLV
ncbi:MAG: glycosyl hydrolase [Bacillota bacterium]